MLNIIKQNTVTLDETLKSLGVTHETLDEWELEERAYFSTLGQEDPWDMHAVAYVELLKELRNAETE